MPDDEIRQPSPSEQRAIDAQAGDYDFAYTSGPGMSQADKDWWRRFGEVIDRMARDTDAKEFECGA